MDGMSESKQIGKNLLLGCWQGLDGNFPLRGV